MPGPVVVTDQGVECRICSFTAQTSSGTESDTVAVQHLDDAHPEISDD